MKVNVTQELIDSGSHYPHTCPVALAMGEAGCEHPLASDSLLSWGGIEERLHVSAPRSVAEFIKRYDTSRAHPPGPFSFNLEDE